MLMSDERNILFVDQHAVRTSFKHYPCSIMESKLAYSKSVLAFPFAHRSPYIPLINHQIMSIWQSGLKSRMFERTHLLKELTNCEEKNVDFKPVTYHNIISAFLAVSCGVFIAISCLFFEMCHFKIKKI